LFNQKRGSRWHRELFRLYWKRKSKASSHQPKVAAETIMLIREMATKNRLWGAQSIRAYSWGTPETGYACVQAHYPEVPEARSPTSARRTDVGNRSRVITRQISGLVTRFPVTDLFFRPLFAFFIIERKITQGDPHRRNTISYRSLGRAYRSGRLLPMGKCLSI